MKKLNRYCWLLGTVVLLSGCASGPKHAQMKSSIPALNPEQGRIYVYRTSAYGAAIQPDVKLNGETVGDAKPKGFFFVDRPPGDYKISTTTEVKRDASFTLEKAQTRYVRLGVSMGFFVGHVYPELVEMAQGQKDIEGCHYIGPALCAPAPGSQQVSARSTSTE